MPLTTLAADGFLDYHFHPGQRAAWDATERTVCLLGGTQSGKTETGPPWLFREIQTRGPGDYLVVTPTFPLLELKALPAFRALFGDMLRLGEYTASPVRRFRFSPDGLRRTFGHAAPADPTTVFFGHADEADSLESATAKAAWLDEAGQRRFRLASKEAVDRRLAIHRGRTLITTTPYNLGWLKKKVYDPWKAGAADVRVVQFPSVMNPAFPREEYERARRELPAWKFDLFYRAVFSRPAGLIYDCFDEAAHRCRPLTPPAAWPRYLGLDFGGVHTAGVFVCEEPATKKLTAYREYRAGGRTAREHAAALRAGEPRVSLCVGGSRSEGQWRDEFTAAGLYVMAPEISEVEVGIGRVYGAFKRGELRVSDDCPVLLEQLATYGRPVDEDGTPEEGIEGKEQYHELDALRYIIGYLRPTAFGGKFDPPDRRGAKRPEPRWAPR
jgi:hypothetical protein